MCKTLQYVFTECYSYEGEHVPNCKGEMKPVVIELCEEAAAEGYPPNVYVYDWYKIPHCQPVVTETREIHTMCTWHQKLHWAFGGAERPDPFAVEFNRFYIPAGDNDTGSPVLVEDDNYTYHIEGSTWENPWFREVNWNPEPRPTTLDPPPMSPKDTTDYTHPETGVVNTLEHPAKWRSADGRPVVLLDIPEDRPRKNSRWPPYAAEFQPSSSQQPAPTEPTGQPSGHNVVAQLPPFGPARASSRGDDTSPSTRSTRSSSNTPPVQPPASQQPTGPQDPLDTLVGALSSHRYFGAETASQAGAGNIQGPANGSPSPHARPRSPSFQPDTPTRSRLPSPAGWQPDSPTKRKRDSNAEGADESPSKRRHTDSSGTRSTPSSSSSGSSAGYHPPPRQSRRRITLRFPNPTGASGPRSGNTQPQPKLTLKFTKPGNPGTSTNQSRPQLTVAILQSNAPLPEFLRHIPNYASHGTPPRPSFSTITNSPDDGDTPPPPPTTRKPKITLKLRQPKVTLKLQLNRAARQRQSQPATTYTGPRTRARARAEAEQARQGPVTRARSRAMNAKAKVNYRV
ncbi:hypothetical protein LTS07_005052 [Exophiala sideris]|uniref:Uncharacterized protein n=1 Tax=Exophiala sideris TaxID=1016849 RepID=A0ABR0JCJ1_9EURO|nr:hypothetical protein LTS07_005052 [Exophiala sideris]KAK5039037.1 hypothetical protein LTR13_004068 [Exophiala sideris]KAK5060922.1 hypothetical protein LTR69_005521 [Exophiala sideris]KAK5183833.1 hypothetical protein LTR44_004115 [Eurotiomycetes sp. CCFEE 6388]